MSLLHVSGISVEEAGITILHNISFTQQAGQKIAVAGETGSGKSTLLQTIAGLVQPSSGTVFFNDKKVIGPHDKLVPGHPNIAYLSQQFELPQFLRVEQVLRYANTLSDKEAERLYHICRISHLTRRRTNQLSGGERQRIALARLLSSWPDLLLLDEPFSNPDMGHKNTLKAVIRDISEELGITLLLISHDPHDTLSWADTILVLQNGKLIQQGTPQKLYKQPVNEYTAGLFGIYTLVPAPIATQLFGLPASNGQHLLLRPENITLTALTNSAAIVGEVQSIQYFGSFYETEVQVNGVSLKARSVDAPFEIGAKVAVKADSFWWV